MVYDESPPPQNEVWVFMERMSTCLDRLLKSISGPVPEEIVCKVAVAVSNRGRLELDTLNNN